MYYDTDVLIIGAGASGLMCAMTAGRRGRRVVIVDHARQPGQKVRIAGGGRGNFTHLAVTPDHYLSETDADGHFCASVLNRFTPQDFVTLVGRHGIAWYEKQPGQLFCTGSAQQLVEMLLAEGQRAGVQYQLPNPVTRVYQQAGSFIVETPRATWRCAALVVATGGLSLPKIGASDLGYRLARQFGLHVVPPRAALVPLLYQQADGARLRDLAGISLPRVQVRCRDHVFQDSLLLTHKGLSGPAILQISSFWRPGEAILLNLLPDHDLITQLKQARDHHPKQSLLTALSGWLPKRLAMALIQLVGCPEAGSQRLAETSTQDLLKVARGVQAWTLYPAGNEGFRTAEVTAGGVDTRELCPTTMASRKVPGLYFIGELVDITGQLGGFNLHWAWASGYTAGVSV
ncbi:MAG: NAD(P)/FAD-dependent oxidoreductase [Magnetococcales bacterium]|nr:NAD(P)/FAD-dependent oxidoreductase [Magnetococcales bacterium]